MYNARFLKHACRRLHVRLPIATNINYNTRGVTVRYDLKNGSPVGHAKKKTFSLLNAWDDHERQIKVCSSSSAGLMVASSYM